MDQLSDRIPVTILTGFLGSGKTTLLNAILKHPELRDTGIVVNEFGKIGLDHLFLVGAIDNVILLDDGCLCCSVKESFQDTLTELFERRARKDVPPFSRVLVETTGMADPGPILRALFEDSFLASVYRLNGVVTTVDAVLGQVELDRYIECRKQVAMADRLMITKVDRTGGTVPADLMARLHAMNPGAAVDVGGANSLKLSDIFSTSAHAPHTIDAHEHDHDHAHGHDHHHTSDVITESFVIPDVASGEALRAWMSFTTDRFGEHMLRVKGIVNVAGDQRPLAIQGVQGIFADPEPLDSLSAEDAKSRLVFIFHGIETAAIVDSLKILAGTA